ncbi:hypothetical protein GCM10009579_82400 [Streptomyces javensis]|uniref:Uncharacterized protein n=1 Tax=Streptomyces javensis TaxID=114698 RepID=A0ABN1XDL2_9ACTN
MRGTPPLVGVSAPPHHGPDGPPLGHHPGIRATNLSADSKDLLQQVRDAKAAVVKDNSVPGYTVRPSQVPAEAVTSSGSGLDPDISPRYAEIQVHRVAARNGLSVGQVRGWARTTPRGARSGSSASRG